MQDEACDCDEQALLDNGDGNSGSGEECSGEVGGDGRKTGTGGRGGGRAAGKSATTSYTLHSWCASPPSDRLQQRQPHDV